MTVNVFISGWSCLMCQTLEDNWDMYCLINKYYLLSIQLVRYFTGGNKSAFRVFFQVFKYVANYSQNKSAHRRI